MIAPVLLHGHEEVCGILHNLDYENNRSPWEDIFGRTLSQYASTVWRQLYEALPDDHELSLDNFIQLVHKWITVFSSHDREHSDLLAYL